jgi:transglutaminase-like putative cysteine protease
MLALIGSSNPNAEVPIFFGLLLLGSLFITGYEAHLRRVERRGVAAAPVTLYLFSAWGVTLAVVLGAVLFPLLVQPVIGPLSPFALPAVNRLRMMANFTQAPQNQAPVGQGPITLSRAPVYEVEAPETGRFRTAVLSHYTGREWTNEGQPAPADKPPDGEGPAGQMGSSGMGEIEASVYRFVFPPDTDRTEPVATRQVRQRITTVGYAPPGIPGLGRIKELLYPRRGVMQYLNGTVTGNYHVAPSRSFEVISEIAEFNDADLRRAPPVNPDLFDAVTLDLPQSAGPERDLAREIAAEHPAGVDQVRAFMEHIERNCSYSLLEDVTPAGEDAAVHYLFRSKRGACDLAATALAVMCRSVGIPARVAVGYHGGEPLPNGGYLLRQEHAHMWTEAFFPGYGWVPFDPAPPLADTKDSFWSVATYRLRQLLGGIGGGGLDALLLVIVVIGTAVLGLYAAFKWLRARWERAGRRRRLENAPGAAVALLYNRGLKVLARRGWTRDAALTPQEYLDAVRAEWGEHPEALAALERLTAGFERSFYGAATSPEAIREAEQAVRDIQRLAPKRPRAPRPVPVRVEGTA